MACTYPTSATSVGEWLDAINMGRYKTALENAGLQVTALHELSEEALQAAGVTMVGHRKRLIQASKALEQPRPAPPSIPASLAPDPQDSLFGNRAGITDVSMDVDMQQSPAPFVFGASASSGPSARASAFGAQPSSSTGAPGGCAGSTTAMDTGSSATSSIASSAASARSQQKANSTSSIYITSTLVTPDTDEVVFCIAAVIHDRIQQGETQSSEDRHRFPFFSEDNNPLYAPPSERNSDVDSSSDSSQKRTRREVPTEDMIFHTIRSVFECARIPSECLIVSLVYIERLIAVSGCPVLVTSWRPILLSALILAQKVWDDRALHNIDFSVFCPMFTLKEINFIEKKFLELIDYDVSITASMYASYYFQLRTLCQRVDREFSLKPMEAASAATLEARGVAYKNKFTADAGGSSRKHQSDNIINGGAPGSQQSSAFLEKLFGS